MKKSRKKIIFKKSGNNHGSPHELSLHFLSLPLVEGGGLRWVTPIHYLCSFFFLKASLIKESIIEYLECVKIRYILRIKFKTTC